MTNRNPEESVISFRISGLSEAISDEVRSTRISPRYGHRVVAESATGTGPCRSCLGLFDLGKDERLLFTYGPPSGTDTLPAPGPVFIHAERCTRYDGGEIPEDLRRLPLILEGRTNLGTIAVSHPATNDSVDAELDRLLADPDIDFVFVRHGEAGCHIARIDRG